LKNLILSNSLLYRSYQKIVRSNNSEFDFFKFIFNKLNNKIGNLNVLDICCGDSYILHFVHEYLNTYTGIDYNKNYLKHCKIRWPNFNFVRLNLLSFNNFKNLNLDKINVIFLNGVIHHFEDSMLIRLMKNLTNLFPNACYIMADPVIYNNNLLNKIMIQYDRGKFIRSKSEYEIVMNKFDSFIVDDFYKMSFKTIFHYKNFKLNNLYKVWKQL